MKNSNRKINVKVWTDVEQSVAYEVIQVIHENKIMKTISLEIEYFDDEMMPIFKEQKLIEGDFYHKLMSESPEFAPGKPENEYRELDLWYIIDQIDVLEGL